MVGNQYIRKKQIEINYSDFIAITKLHLYPNLENAVV